MGTAELKLKSLEWPGKILYSLYLVHYPVMAISMMIWMRLFGAVNPLVYFFLSSAAVIAIAYVYFVLIESKLLKARFRTVKTVGTNAT